MLRLDAEWEATGPGLGGHRAAPGHKTARGWGAALSPTSGGPGSRTLGAWVQEGPRNDHNLSHPLRLSLPWGGH